MRIARWIIHNKYLQLCAGIVLLISVLFEFLHIHAGLIVLGIFHVIGALPNIIQALERVSKIDEEE